MLQGLTGSQSILDHQPEDLPDRFEAGTLNAAGIKGLGAGVEYILTEGVEKIRKHEKELTALLYQELISIPGLSVYGPVNSSERVAVISFNIKDIAPEEIAYILDEVYGIMVRAGLHCSPQAHRCLGTETRGTVRVSPGFFKLPAPLYQRTY